MTRWAIVGNREIVSIITKVSLYQGGDSIILRIVQMNRSGLMFLSIDRCSA